MIKVFDEEHVHDFWGLSPCVDIVDVLQTLPISVSQHSTLERLAQADALHILQASRSCVPPKTTDVKLFLNSHKQQRTVECGCRLVHMIAATLHKP